MPTAHATRTAPRLSLGALLALALVLGLPVVTPARAGSPPELPPGGVPGVHVPTLRWTDAGDGYQQTTAAVPYDYADPGGATFPLHVVRLPATDPAHRIGALFVNFGGPGGEAAETVRAAGRFLLPPQVLARYDLVGVDPRGTGQSRPVRCTSSTQEQERLPYVLGAKIPLTRAEEAEAIEQSRRFARACQARNGDLLEHVGTLPFARDLDVLRAAMGDRRINLYGLSYGTFLGQVVANTFPSRTGAIVLDAVVDPAWATGSPGSVSWTRTNSDVGGWETMQRFFTLCAQAGRAGCAFAGHGDPEERFARLAARLRETPLMVPWPGRAPLAMGYSELVGVTVSTLYVAGYWPLLARLLQAADASDAATVGRIARQLTPPASPGNAHFREAQKAIACGDTDNPRDPHRYGQVGRRRDATVAPYAGSLWANLALVCAPWQARASERYTGPWTARTRTPVLVVNNRYDPATPYRSAVEVSRLLPNSALLTVDAVGHGSILTSACVTAVTTRYLLTGATPAAGRVCRPDAGPFEQAASRRSLLAAPIG